MRFLWMSSVVALLVITMVSMSAAQPYEDVFDFDITNGAYPQYPNLLAQGRDGHLYSTTLSGGINSEGTVFRIAPTGTQDLLYSFEFNSSLNGDSPFSGLTLGTDGYLYGTTGTGGTDQFGTIFKISPTGKLTTLYSFTGSDGSDPVAPPIQGADGAFYGTTYGGTAYRITASGVFTPIATLPGSSTAPLTLAADGSLYGTTLIGGRFGGGTVFKMTPSGALSVVFNFDSGSFNSHGASPFAPVTQGSDGSFYGTTFQGGLSGGGTIYKLTPRGVQTILLYFDPNSPLAGYAPYAGLVQATDGNFYGATYYGGAGADGVIFQVTPDGVYSVVHNFDGKMGRLPAPTPMQNTNGKIYGLASFGGASDVGVVYSLDMGLAPFVKTLPMSGRPGQSVEILGQGFVGTTAVSFNGVPASFVIKAGTYLVATIPSNATTGFVTVTTPSGTLTSNNIFHVRQ